MEEQTENHYGNITFSQLAHFIVSLCGKDALLGYDALLSEKKLTESEINDAYKEKGTYEKFRFTDKNSIFGKVWDFFTKLEDEFEILKNENLCPYSLDGKKEKYKNTSLSQYFYYNIIWYYILNIGTSLETDQATLSKSILFPYLWNDDILFFYILLCKNVSLEKIFVDFKNKHGKTYEEIYKLIADNSEDEEADSISIKRTLEQCRKDNKNPPWKVFYPLLKTFHNIDKEYSEKLFNYYFYTNFKKSLKHLDNLLEYYNQVKDLANNPKTFLDGREIMKILNLKPSKIIGKILDELKELQLSGEINSKDEAINFIKSKKLLNSSGIQ